MKKILLCFLLLVVCTITTYAQQMKTHVVKKGENVFRISKKYDTTEEEIYRVNPGAKDGIKEGQVLAIPVTTEDEYETHEVQEDDTVYSLANTYNTTQEAIFALNPEAVNGIQLGQILKIRKLEKPDATTDIDNPGLDKNPVLDSLKVREPEIIGFRTHKVKRKETLYSIAKNYDITIDDIKKHNKRLYSEQLKRKDKIRIPIFAKEPEMKVPELDSIGGKPLVTTRYRIQPKDTKYGIARRHGITVQELEQLNPNLDPSFPIGVEIIVPTSYYVAFDKVTAEDGFELYEVPKGETVFNLLRISKISSDSLFRMNPYLKDGLKEGMVIKIPKRVADTMVVDTMSVAAAKTKFITLEDKLYNFKPKKLALMLPFALDTLNMDTRNQTEEFLQKRQSVRIALDLYKGILMAIDSAKTKGITTELNVYDTQKNNNADYIKELINQNDFDQIDAVIGPMYQSNVQVVMTELKKYDTPVFSPVSKTKKGFQAYGNFFQTRPSSQMMQDKLISYIKKDSTDKNIVIIIQHGPRFEEVKNKLMAEFPDAKIAKTDEKNFIYDVNLLKALHKTKPNWVILESRDVALISNATAMLNAKAESHQITLFTTDKNSAFEDDSVKNQYLSKLHLHYPSIDKEFDNNGEESDFVKNYRKKYGTTPTKFVVRGYDIAYDILLRLGSADDLYHAVSFGGTTEYIESKFNYVQQPLGGYDNQAIYLIKFEDDLLLTVVE